MTASAGVFVELAQEEDFLSRIGEKHEQHIKMTVRHREDECGLVDQFIVHLLAAVMGNLDAEVCQCLHCLPARGVPVGGAYACRFDLKIRPFARQMPE